MPSERLQVIRPPGLTTELPIEISGMIRRPALLLLAFALVVVAVLLPRSSAGAETPVRTPLWDAASPIALCTYQTGRPESVSASQFTNSVSRGVQTWNAAGAAITLRYDGACSSGELAENGVNEIGFVDRIDGDDSVIGRATSYWVVGRFRLETDIQILALPADGPWTPCTLQALITHELGHVVSLGHSDDIGDVMAPFLIDCASQLPLEETMDALRGAYGLNASAPPFPEAVVVPVAAVPAVSTEPPFLILGGGLKVGDIVATTVNGASCGSATVGATGGWTILIIPETCEVKNGDSFDFWLNGAAATQTFVFTGSSVPGQSLAPIGVPPLTVMAGAPSAPPSVAVVPSAPPSVAVIPSAPPSVAIAPSAPTATVLAAPPVGGTTTGLAGTTDIVVLIAAQTFTVDSVWKLDIATQDWQSYVPGAPAFVNTLVLTSPSDVVSMIRGTGPKITPTVTTPAPTATGPSSPTPVAPGASAVAALLTWYDQVTELYDQVFATRRSAGDGVSYSAASVELFAHRKVVEEYGNTLDTLAYSLNSYAPGCELARQAIVTSARGLGNIAGWWGLIFDGWPNADYFDEAGEAADLYFETRSTARTAIALCRTLPTPAGTVSSSPTPVAPGASAVAALLTWYDQVTELYDQVFATRRSAGDGVSYSVASVELFAHRKVVEEYGNTLDTLAYSLNSYAPGCELARQAIVTSARGLGNIAGWWGLIFDGWPNADYFDEVGEAADLYFETRSTALAAIALCRTP